MLFRSQQSSLFKIITGLFFAIDLFSLSLVLIGNTALVLTIMLARRKQSSISNSEKSMNGTLATNNEVHKIGAKLPLSTRITTILISDIVGAVLMTVVISNYILNFWGEVSLKSSSAIAINLIEEIGGTLLNNLLLLFLARIH